MRAAAPASLMFNHNAEHFADVVIAARRRGGQILRRRASLG
jgi:hypothetical protein